MTPELYLTINYFNTIDREDLEEYLDDSSLEYSLFSENKTEVVYKLSSTVMMSDESCKNYILDLKGIFEEFAPLLPYFEEMTEGG